MQPLFLWVLLCFNDSCTDSQLQKAKTYTGVRSEARKECEADRKAVKTQWNRLFKTTYRSACKTQKQMDDHGIGKEYESKATPDAAPKLLRNDM